MGKKSESGTLFGIPYNFKRPSIGRLLSAHWKPDKGMLVEKPFGIGYTLNLASWRSWIALAVVGGLLYQERSGGSDDDGDSVDIDGDDGDEPVEVIVEE
ncbi:hypothetical protein EGH24_04380 [Halonotius terrestris]|uniref:DUF5808 domain-containing protein n=1 Tax=Halonotius terrestris TaxID=2487750 RepID=A0A8J8PAG8_9EURY|nr:DUF5808 domain-containing protein [Halonotius terrestris]TQQ82691.1 hypothetical protein EGH24_04380 [Halonotius terrestris]